HSSRGDPIPHARSHEQPLMRLLLGHGVAPWIKNSDLSECLTPHQIIIHEICSLEDTLAFEYLEPSTR
ncbi:jg21364, partial [Pararge aegeria aegeria]